MTKYKKNSLYKAQGCTKIALAILLIMLFSAGIVSAWDWDNVKRYDDNGKYGTIRIVNALGLGSTIASYTLEYNTDTCSLNCYATGTATLNADARLFTQLKFKDSKGTLKSIVSNNIYLREYYNETINVYDKDNKTIIGTKEIEKSRLVEYKGDILKAGTYEWKITGTKEKTERIDWIASTDFGGFELTEWAWWSPDYALRENYEGTTEDYTSVYDSQFARQNFTIGTVGLDEDFNSIAISINLIRVGTITDIDISILNQSYKVMSVNTTFNPMNVDTVSYRWYNITFPKVIFKAGQQYYIELNGTDGDSSNKLNWQRDTASVGTYDGGGASFSSDDGISWTSYPLLDFDFAVYKSDTFNVNLLTPADGMSSVNSSINFSSSYESSLLPIFTNATYMLYKGTILINETTETVNAATNFTSVNISNLETGSYTWNVVACGDTTETYCYSSPNNYTFTLTGFQLNDLYYKNKVYETANEFFQANITVPTGATLHSAVLYYNGTGHSSSTTLISGRNYRIYKSIDIPTIQSNVTKNFFWGMAYTNITGGIVYENSSVYTQNVSKINLANCNATYTIKVVNFTSKDSINYNYVNTTFLSSWNYWLGTGTQKINYSYQDTLALNSSWEFCISENLTFITDATISHKGSGFAQNWYYLAEAELNNTINYITLYNLNEGNSTITTLHVQDNYENPLADRIIQVQKYDVGTDTYFTVAMAKTNFEGNDIVYLNWYDTFYKFVITYNGAVELITEPTKISASPITFTIRPDVLFHYDEFSDVSWTLVFNNATSNFVLTFVDASGAISEGCLQVQRYTSLTQDVVCDICEASASATLYCNIGSYRNGTYTATFYAKGSWPWHVFEVITEYFRIAERSVFDKIGVDNGTVMIVILAGTVMALGLFNPAAAIIMFLIGLFVGSALGFTILNFGAFIGLVIVGVIIIWKLQT